MRPDPLAPFAPLLEQLAIALAPHVARQLLPLLVASDAGGELIDQHSPEAKAAGTRAFIAAIRNGTLRGRRIGRRWVAKREDLVAFVAGRGGRGKPTAPPESEPTEPDPPAPADRSLDALAAELGLRVVPGERRR